eukprot:292671-Amphidinium_carterae.1
MHLHIRCSAARLKRILRYLVGTPRMRYEFHDPSDEEETGISIYLDSDHGECPKSRRSTTGVVVLRSGHMLSEQSLTQPVVALSSGEGGAVAAALVAPVRISSLIGRSPSSFS